jgi:hypothetical protein
VAVAIRPCTPVALEAPAPSQGQQGQQLQTPVAVAIRPYIGAIQEQIQSSNKKIIPIWVNFLVILVWTEDQRPTA